MSVMHIRQVGKAPLLSEATLEGMVFNTPVPYYDMGVSCGNPLESGNVATQNSCPHILLFLFYLLHLQKYKDLKR